MYKALESWKAAGLPEFELSSSKKLFFDKHPEEEIIVKPYAFVEEEKLSPEKLARLRRILKKAADEHKKKRGKSQ